MVLTNGLGISPAVHGARFWTFFWRLSRWLRSLSAAPQARKSEHPYAVPKHADKVISLTRGCCLPWADPPRKSSDGRTHAGSAASFLISAACREMTKKGYNVFVAYADPAANEKGTIYQSLGWSLSVVFTNPTEKFRRPDGKVYDARNVHLLTSDRRFGKLRYKRSRAEQKKILIEEGCEFFKDDGSKHRGM